VVDAEYARSSIRGGHEALRRKRRRPNQSIYYSGAKRHPISEKAVGQSEPKSAGDYFNYDGVNPMAISSMAWRHLPIIGFCENFHSFGGLDEEQAARNLVPQCGRLPRFAPTNAVVFFISSRPRIPARVATELSEHTFCFMPS
jgi:hypothetical protein